jgi:hypothetical protein
VKDKIFNKICPDEALAILRRLSKNDTALKEKIIKAAEDLIRDANVDEICEAVFYALDGIDVHELWDRAGLNRDGYTSPEDMSFEMFEETLEPFLRNMQRLLCLKMHEEAKFHCMAILKGIYKYEEESKSEFKDWATDVPGECFGSILSEWAKKCRVKDIKNIKDFIKEECPAWSNWAIKQI